DSKASVEIMDLLHQLHQQGVTVVMVTHEPDIASHAGRIICVRDGKTIAAGHCSDKTL
ncbi:MAG: macrolide ABC transporter ATP-binding protein, partial [Chloroflexi bacterium]|nr:macrolide ABC transporter ATP-binding protein [Chloroflexota bacterium]